MDIEQEFENALGHGSPRAALRGLVAQLTAAAIGQPAIYEHFEGLRAALRAAGRDRDEDHVLEVMDEIVGWCSPHVRLFPDDLVT